ncbi:hypothetical protein ACFLT2_05695 [Acidobacteriota bacterium]
MSTKISRYERKDESEGMAEANLKTPTQPSLPEPLFEGTRRSRVRGLCEHDMNNQTVMILAEEQRRMRTDKHAEFAGPQKVGEGMALKIWAERRHLFSFIFAFFFEYLLL